MNKLNSRKYNEEQVIFKIIIIMKPKKVTKNNSNSNIINKFTNNKQKKNIKSHNKIKMKITNIIINNNNNKIKNRIHLIINKEDKKHQDSKPKILIIQIT